MARLTDDQVIYKISSVNGYNIKAWDWAQAMIDYKVYLPKCRWAHTKWTCNPGGDCKGHWYMPQMRDLLKALDKQRGV